MRSTAWDPSSTAADENAGAFNGEWDTGANNGLQNIGAFNGVFDDGTSNGNDNLGAFNGSFNSSADNGNGNIGTFNGNFNGNTVLVGNGTTTNDLVFGDGSVDVASGEEPGRDSPWRRRHRWHDVQHRDR